MKILGGVHQPDAGEILVDGTADRIATSTGDAAASASPSFIRN